MFVIRVETTAIERGKGFGDDRKSGLEEPGLREEEEIRILLITNVEKIM